MGRSRGGLTTKVQIACDSLGRPVCFLIAPGQSHDILAAPGLLEGYRPSAVLADRAYDANSLRRYLDQIGAEAVIPSTRSRKTQSLTTRCSASSATVSSAASTASSTSAASPRALTGSPVTTSPSSTSPLRSSGCVECRFVLVDISCRWTDGTQKHRSPRPVGQLDRLRPAKAAIASIIARSSASVASRRAVSSVSRISDSEDRAPIRIAMIVA